MKKIKTYLIGSIQDADDPNKAREKVDNRLTEMGFEVLNPCKLEVNQTLSDTIEGQKNRLTQLKKQGKWEEFDAVMDSIIDMDLQCVTQSQFLVVFWDTQKKHGGTIEEILHGIAQSKPIYVICSDPMSTWNDWILRRLRRAKAKFFSNNKQFLEFMEKEHG